VLFFIPYKVITGGYLSHYAAVLLFVSIAVCFFAALWRWYVKKYMPDVRFAFYILSFAALFFSIGLFTILRLPTVYASAQAAGLMFITIGVYLLLKSVENEKMNRLMLFFACLCFALAVGSRPNLVLASLFVPLVLWKHRSWKLLMFIAIPYAIVAIPLCMYNYARFESIFDFGINYHIGIWHKFDSSLIGLIIRIFDSIVSYLALPNRYSLYFPFVEYIPRNWMVHGGFLVRLAGSGLINFPIVFCLFYMCKRGFRSNMPEVFRFSSAFFIVGVVLLIGVSCANLYYGRYMVDFAFFIIFPSLCCAYFWCYDENSVHQYRTRLKVTYVLLTVSILIGLFLFVSGDHNSPGDPTLYRYLEYSLGIFRDI
jgi:hypothetical protein